VRNSVDVLNDAQERESRSDGRDFGRMGFVARASPRTVPHDDNQLPAHLALDDGGRGMSVVAGPLSVTGSAADAMRFALATSLSRFRAEANQSRPRFSPFDVSIDARYVSFRDKRASRDLDGHFGLVSIADYVTSRTLLVGAMAQFDSMRQRSHLQTSEASGRGWIAGPYATLRLAENVFWQARAGGADRITT
jgi:hypothetical protein